MQSLLKVKILNRIKHMPSVVYKVWKKANRYFHGKKQTYAKCIVDCVNIGEIQPNRVGQRIVLRAFLSEDHVS